MRYPECFPDNFEESILPKLDNVEPIEVFRAIRHVEICRDDFLSTHEMVLLGKRPSMPDDDVNCATYYSTSCNIEHKRLKKILSVFMIDDPRAFIATGLTAVECGPSKKTCDWCSQHKGKTHVDWWIYRDSNPEDYFRKGDDVED